MVMQDWDAGKSEGSVVMNEIQVLMLLECESMPTSSGSFFVKEFGESIKRGLWQMTVVSMTGAASACSKTETWKTVDWVKAEKHVYRLQMRIAKAVNKCKYGKVRALQWLLTKSHYAKLLAVRRVTSSKGAKTPGIDGETLSSGKAKYQAINSLNTRGYRSSPLRRVYIPKRDGKKRPLGIPTMRDRAMQALQLMALEPIAESTADPNSYGFRRERSQHDANSQCHIVLASRNCAQWILEADIKACFDEISHDWLLQNIPINKGILEQWLKAGFIDKNLFYDTDAGVPQGGVISPTLANMALDGLEEIIHKACRKTDKVNFVRFADDFIVTGNTKELLENKIKPAIEQFLMIRGLRLSQAKTTITHIDNGFNFLGYNIRKYNGKYLGKPAKENVKTFLRNVKVIFKRGYGWSGADLIKILNPKIKGWANYYRVGVSKSTYSKIDNEIYRMSIHWVLRKFFKRQRQKAVKRYFRRRHVTRNWIFSDIEIRNEKEKRIVSIVKMMDTKIQRHVKIRSIVNPFIPKDREYFQQRELWKTKVRLTQRKVDKDIYARMQMHLQPDKKSLKGLSRVR